MADLSHTATFALLHTIVIVLVSTTGNSAAGMGLADSSPPSGLNYSSPSRAAVWINAAEDVAVVAAFAMTGMVIANFAARTRWFFTRNSQPVNWF